MRGENDVSRASLAIKRKSPARINYVSTKREKVRTRQFSYNLNVLITLLLDVVHVLHVVLHDLTLRLFIPMQIIRVPNIMNKILNILSNE